MRHYRWIVLFLIAAFAATAVAGEMKVVTVKGDVYVRRGVQENWQRISSGDILKPEDSIKSGKRSSASILVDERRKLVIPEMVIIDASDLRTLSQDELLLKLAMEHVRSVPVRQPSNGEVEIPRTTTVHGSLKSEADDVIEPLSIEVGMMQLNGTKVLCDNGFFATAVLKAKETLRRAPALNSRVDVRLMIATAMEKMKLNGEALTEYSEIQKLTLSLDQRALVERKLVQLRKKIN
jgi:hypothetical protein